MGKFRFHEIRVRYSYNHTVTYPHPHYPRLRNSDGGPLTIMWKDGAKRTNDLVEKIDTADRGSRW